MSPRKKFDKALKEQVVLHILTNESIGGKSVKELNVQCMTVRSGVRCDEHDGANAFPGNGNLISKEDEMRKLRKQLADLKKDNEILKKAAVYFAKNLK